MRQICELRNGNEACLTTTSMKSRHRPKLKFVLAEQERFQEMLNLNGCLGCLKFKWM